MAKHFTGKLFLLNFCVFVGINHTFAQRTGTASDGSTMIIEYMLQGDSLLKIGEPKEAIVQYRKEYQLFPALGCYGLACSFARDRETDSAFKYLEENLQYETDEYPIVNPDFLYMHGDKRWDEFVNKAALQILVEKPGKFKDTALTKKLWEMHAWDQAYYYEIAIVENKIGKDSPVAKAFWELKDSINKRNLNELDSIISANGWPKKSEVGEFAIEAAFLIVQHSTLEKMEKYLPLIKSLCEQKEADWDEYAMMYDRIQILQNKPQLYGSQYKFNYETMLYEFYPIDDEKNVNKRRAAMKMAPLEEYASYYGVTYTPKK